MLYQAENEALNAIRAYLDPGESAIGTAVNVRHLAATPVGRLDYCGSRGDQSRRAANRILRPRDRGGQGNRERHAFEGRHRSGQIRKEAWLLTDASSRIRAFLDSGGRKIVGYLWQPAKGRYADNLITRPCSSVE